MAEGGPALVIFDCDGVLVDSERVSLGVEAKLLAELGWPLSEQEVFERFVGRTDRYQQQEIEKALGRPVPDWVPMYHARLFAAFRTDLRPVPGVAAALDALAAAEIPTCVASSGSHDKMELTLGLTGLWDRVAGHIYSASEVGRGKPAPDLFLYAAGREGAEPAGCVVVEDSPSGVAAARAAGMRVLGFAGGITPAASLEGPDTTVFIDMADLPGLVRSAASRA